MAAQEVTTDVFVSLRGEDVRAGRLWTRSRSGNESATFAYADEYIAHQDAYELDPSLPLHSGQQQTAAGRKMFGAFSDCAPDRWGRELMKVAAKEQGGGARQLGEADFLLGVRDELRQGALRFRDPATGDFLAVAADGVPALLDLPILLSAAEHLERDDATAADIAALLRGGTSPGGARPKAHVRKNDGTMAIAKFPSPQNDTWDVMRWEAVALRLAGESGIHIPDWTLETIDDRPVLILDRFDRAPRTRVGYVSAMTMLELGDGERGSYLDIVDLIEREGHDTTGDLRELWRRIAFNVLISNTDDHLRNHGFLRSTTDGWSLSPAFDLNPDPDPGVKYLRTAIDGDFRADIDALMGIREFCRLDDSQAREVLSEVLGATARWRDVAREVGLDGTAIEAMALAFDHPQSERAREITTAGARAGP